MSRYHVVIKEQAQADLKKLLPYAREPIENSAHED